MMATPVAAELAINIFTSANCKRSKLRNRVAAIINDSPTATATNYRRVSDGHRSIAVSY